MQVFIFADHPAGRHKLKQRMHDFADMSLHGWTEYPDASFQRVQAHALYSMYEWVCLVLALVVNVLI